MHVKHHISPLFYLLCFIGFALLYVPLGRLVLFSFNDSRRNIIWKGFTTQYYEKAFYNDELREALLNSLIIAFSSALFAVIIGTMAAILLSRFRFRLKLLYESVIMMPLVIPEICLAVAMLVFLYAIDVHILGWIWPLNLINIILGHILFCLPFAVIIIRARLVGYNRDIEDVSKDLGASEWQTMRYILLPFLRPSLIIAFLVAFTVSLDDFVITFFLSGPNTLTLPVKIFSMTRFGVSPQINVISTMLILFTVIILSTAILIYHRKEK